MLSVHQTKPRARDGGVRVGQVELYGPLGAIKVNHSDGQASDQKRLLATSSASNIQ